MTQSLVTLAIDTGAAPPSSFRIFRRGSNSTRKGAVLFDDAAARAVMADYRTHGTDIAIDLEHLSLDPDARHHDPDARGWCRLEVRGGELWAVDVRWTADGAERLRARRQRYISPAFQRGSDGRPRSLHNIAITSTPATDEAPALVAASARAPVRRLSDTAVRAIAGLPTTAPRPAQKAPVMTRPIIALTATDRELCRLSGTDTGAFLAQKRKLAARDIALAGGEADAEAADDDAEPLTLTAETSAKIAAAASAAGQDPTEFLEALVMKALAAPPAPAGPAPKIKKVTQEYHPL